jgi:secreted trypsin-like serine protease
VVNGQNAVAHSWPWTVWVTYRGDDGMGFTCGGTLIGLAQTPGESDIVITAAHCVLDQNGQPFDPSGYTIFVGNHDVSKQEVAEVQVGVTKYVHHEEYQPINNDIAVMRLAKPVKFNNYIKPACLPQQGKSPSDPSNCYAAGWGRMYNENQNTARILQQVRLPVLPDNTCYNTWGNNFDQSSMLCAGYLEGSKNVCNGDSGGPLVCKENGRWTLFGSVSFGNAGACAVRNRPGVFARISNYRNWIEQKINELRS